jgi:hypothetical protein
MMRLVSTDDPDFEAFKTAYQRAANECVRAKRNDDTVEFETWFSTACALVMVCPGLDYFPEKS